MGGSAGRCKVAGKTARANKGSNDNSSVQRDKEAQHKENRSGTDTARPTSTTTTSYLYYYLLSAPSEGRRGYLIASGRDPQGFVLDHIKFVQVTESTLANQMVAA